MAVKSKSKVKVGGRRGGRRPGAWTLTSPEQVKKFREENRVSRATLAKLVGVSSTSVQNWETGIAIATTRAQSRLVEVMANSSALPKPGVRNAAFHHPLLPLGGQGGGSVIETTAKIVVGYLECSKDALSADGLTKLIRDVRGALS